MFNFLSATFEPFYFIVFGICCYLVVFGYLEAPPFSIIGLNVWRESVNFRGCFFDTFKGMHVRGVVHELIGLVSH